MNTGHICIPGTQLTACRSLELLTLWCEGPRKNDQELSGRAHKHGHWPIQGSQFAAPSAEDVVVLVIFAFRF